MEIGARETLYKTLAILYRYADEITVLEYPRRIERRSVDLAVRMRDGRRVLVKVARDLNEIPKSELQELLALASSMNISPIIVSERRGSEELFEGVAYEKMGLRVVSPETLEGILSGREPVYIFESRDGYKVRLDPVKVRERRIEKGLSLGDLAIALKTSRKAVYEYERGRIDPTIERAERLISLLGEDIVVPCDIFDTSSLPEPRKVKPFDSKLEERAARSLEAAGFRVVHAKKTVIDIGGSIEEKRIVFTVQHPRESNKTIYEKSVYMERMARTLEIEGKGVIVEDKRIARDLEKEGVNVILADNFNDLIRSLMREEKRPGREE